MVQKYVALLSAYWSWEADGEANDKNGAWTIEQICLDVKRHEFYLGQTEAAGTVQEILRVEDVRLSSRSPAGFDLQTEEEQEDYGEGEHGQLGEYHSKNVWNFLKGWLPIAKLKKFTRTAWIRV